MDFQKNNFAALSVGNGRKMPIPSLLPCDMNLLKVYMSPSERRFPFWADPKTHAATPFYLAHSRHSNPVFFSQSDTKRSLKKGRSFLIKRFQPVA
jgi:hypothetical protein